MTDKVATPVQILAANEDDDSTNYDEFTLKKEALRASSTRFLKAC